jgi:hypothetical protein
VIVAFPSPVETVGVPGVPGAATFQIAVKVTFDVVMLYVALAWYVFVPLLQPPNEYPDFVAAVD